MRLKEKMYIKINLIIMTIQNVLCIVVSEDPGGNLNFTTNINPQQSTLNKAMICKRNKFINRTNVSLRLATSSEYE